MALRRPDAKLLFQHGNGEAGYFVILHSAWQFLHIG